MTETRTHIAAGAIIPLLDKEQSLSTATRRALIDLVSAYERDKYTPSTLGFSEKPVLYISEKQLDAVGEYMPTRKEAEGNFTLALYRHQSPEIGEQVNG